MSEIPFGPITINAGAYAAKAIGEGMSSNQFRAAFRAEGGSMSNQSLRSVYNQARDALAGRDVIAGLDYNAIPPGDAFVDWAAGAEGNYATFVTSLVRMPGERELETRYFIHSTSDPHTPQEAIDAAAAHYTDDSTSDEAYRNASYQGGFITSMTRTTGG